MILCLCPPDKLIPFSSSNKLCPSLLFLITSFTYVNLQIYKDYIIYLIKALELEDNIIFYGICI